MTPNSRALFVLGVLLGALGCTSTPAPLPTPAADPSLPAASTPRGPTPTVSALPTAATSSPSAAPPATAPLAGPAWQAILDSINDDGSVSQDTALQAFSIAFGPLPGVSVPQGEAGFVGSGTMAMHWLVGYWDELTSDQQQAAIA